MPNSPLTPVVDLLQRIPLSARVVMDVGCGRGDLLGAYRLMNPGARLLGIEPDPDPEAAAVAHTRLHEFMVADPTIDPLPFDLPNGIDCIVHATVLPSVSGPFALIRRHAELLNPDGTMLICVPKIDHWSFALRLLRGTWDYEPSGLLDHGHLRWFNLENMRKGLIGAGLIPCDTHPRVFGVEQIEAFVRVMTPALEALGVDPVEYQRRSGALQHIWRVRKAPQTRLIVSSTMLPPVGGVSHVRVLHPLNAIASEPMVSGQLSEKVGVEFPPDAARVLILHRPALSGDHGRTLLQSLTDDGWVVVTEFDDNPDFFQLMQDDEQLTFRGVHAIQTSTPVLAEVLRRRNPEVVVFPDAITTLPEVHNFADAHSLTMFFGALNREQDWRELIPAINAVIAQVGDKLRFQVVHDRGFFEALETDCKQFTPICDYDTYLGLLGQCELSFMPLEDNLFNRSKSDLKFIEAGSRRVAPIASPVVYADSIRDGETGLLVHDADDLRAKLTRLVLMPELARRIADGAREYVARERMLAYQVAERVAWYRSLWERREELNARRLERLATPYRPAA